MTYSEAIDCLMADKEYLVDYGVCDGEEMDVAISAIKELQEYRATGLSPTMIEDLKKSEKRAHKIAINHAMKLEKKAKKYKKIGAIEETQDKASMIEEKKDKMRVKIDDFLLVMGKICDEHSDYCTSNCPLAIETDTFHGCVKDNLLHPECRTVLKRETLKSLKEVGAK